MYGVGISKEGEVLDLAVKYDVINKSGAWFSYKDARLGQGRDNVKEYFKQNPELFEEISAQVREKVNQAANEKAAPPKKTPIRPAAGSANVDVEVEK